MTTESRAIHQIALRVDQSLASKIDAEVARLSAETGLPVHRSSVVRAILICWMERRNEGQPDPA